MKQCTQCKKNKDLNLFNNRKASKDGKAFSCKECNKKHVKKHYMQNKQSYIDRARKYSAANRNWLREYKKSLVCSICGEGNNRPWILDFHHVNPEDKINSIGNILHTKGLKGLKKEINKCIVVCSNCHRDIHNKK